MAYDYIVIGAGSAGCVLANRLSADPSKSVLLLEAGDKDSNFWIHIPVGFTKTLNNPEVNWNFQTEPEENVSGRQIPIPRGRVLGGSSSINGMLYVRGQAFDYNVWAQLGNRGWSYEDVLPYFQKSENFERGSDNFRGKGGLLNVADMYERHDLIDAFIDAGEELGYKHNPDYNGAVQDGFGYYQITQRNGRRESTARAFLNPAKGRKNLTVEARAHVTKINFDGKKAVGINYSVDGLEKTENANAEVILCAGAVQSPQILELSGIGEAERLKVYGIRVQHDLPGVGNNLADHYISRLSWRLRRDISLNNRAHGLGLVGEILRYGLTRRGLLSLPAGILSGFVRSREGLAGPDIQYHIAHASFANPAKRVFDKFPGMTFGPCQLRPESRGTVHIKSPNPLDAPVTNIFILNPSYFTSSCFWKTVYKPYYPWNLEFLNLCL